MSKLSITILLFLAIILSCKKEPSGIDKNEVYFAENQSVFNINGWEISKYVLDFQINPRDIYFINSDIGFVAGYNGDIYKTIDAGMTWRKQNSGTTLHIHSIFFLNENVGFASTQAMNCLDPDCDKGSVLLKTTDGGETWEKIFFPDYTRISSLKFFDELKGVALIQTPNAFNSGDETIAVTSDGGISWNFVYMALKPSYNKIFYVDNIIFVAGENHKIFKSSDYGYTWETISTPVEAYDYVRNLYFYNEKIGLIDGFTDIFKTTDGGSTWIKTSFPFKNFGTLHFYNENEGFNILTVSAYEGGDFPAFKGSNCYETENSGENWIKSDLIDSLHLGLTYFQERNSGYAIKGSEFYVINKKD